MSYVVINPGTGPVYGGTARNACLNARAFGREVGADSVTYLPRSAERRWAEDDGRYTFRLRRGRKTCVVTMPGLRASQVRYLRSTDQNIWDFPRLYVNGSSYVWDFAIGYAADVLTP